MKLTKTLFFVLSFFLYGTVFSQSNEESLQTNETSDSTKTDNTAIISDVSNNTTPDSLIATNETPTEKVEETNNTTITETVAVTTPTPVKSNTCNPRSYLDSCRTKISNDQFTDIKEFLIENKNQKMIEHSFTFTAGTSYEYYFTGYQEGQQQVIAKLLDAKKKVVATNQVNHQFLHKITFDCKKTDIYYIQFTFLDNEQFCGAGVLGFTKRQEVKKKK